MSSDWLAPDRAYTWWDADRTEARTVDVEREVADDPVSVVFQRAGSSLAAQTVRLLQPTSRGAEQGGVAGEEAEADLLVLGTSALDVQRGDTFEVGGSWYEVFYVGPYPPSSGERVEAKARQLQ